MRLDMIGLRTWLLATVVGWALLVCVLAVAGLGKRVELLPDDPALVQRLPTLPAPAPERLGAFEKYSEIAAHPAFAEDRLPHPFFLSGNDGGTAASTVRLTGVLLTDNFKMATLTLDPQDSVRVQLGGEAVKGWRLLALQPRSATVEGPSGTQTLELHVFNGQGGQPPTANAAARGAATATPPVPSPDAAALAPPQPPQPQPVAPYSSPAGRHRQPCRRSAAMARRKPHAPPTIRCVPSANASKPDAASCNSSARAALPPVRPNE